jgi:hypothetical protein
MNHYETLLPKIEGMVALNFNKKKDEKIAALKLELEEATKFLDVLPKVFIANRLYAVRNNVTSLPICPGCDTNICGFNKLDNNLGFVKFCCQKCSNEYAHVSPEVRNKLGDYELMFDLRINKQLSYRTMGDVIGCSDFTVIRWLERHKISIEEYNKIAHKVRNTLSDPSFLVEEYVNKGKTLQEIANELCTSKSTVSVAMRKHGIICK